jgi:Ni/Co efflux regulator RcnB/surface antigen
MKRIFAAFIALSMIAGAGVALAQPGDHGRNGRDERDCGQPGQPPCDHAGPPPNGPRWSRGDRLPSEYRDDRYQVPDWRRNNLPRPPRGYRWMCYEHGNCFLVADRTGVIRDARWRGDRDYRWRQRYSRTYSYEDDIYYRECRSRPDPAGILIGGLIGGLIGHAAGDERAGATFAGIIIGGALGGALTRDMDCDDRSYAYYAYYHGLNRGYPGVYRWHNPHNRHHGDFHVRNYYYDSNGFHCANYRHVVYLNRRQEAFGHACRQPDGAWSFLD